MYNELSSCLVLVLSQEQGGTPALMQGESGFLWQQARMTPLWFKIRSQRSCLRFT